MSASAGVSGGEIQKTAPNENITRTVRQNMKLQILRRNPVRTLSQRPLCLRAMLLRIREREHRRKQNREFWRRFFGLDRPKTHSGRLGDRELVESNLPLP